MVGRRARGYGEGVIGTAKKRLGTNPPDRADDLADIVLRDHRGAEVRLGDMWRDGPAVLVFLRHYG